MKTIEMNNSEINQNGILRANAAQTALSGGVGMLEHSIETINSVISNNLLNKTVSFTGLPDYSQYVIGLLPYNSEYRWLYGRLLLARDNSIYAPCYVQLCIAKIWDHPSMRCNNTVFSNNKEHRLCTFIYGGVQYIGIHAMAAANAAIKILNIDSGNYEPFQIQIKAYDEILNPEIYNSIIHLNWDGTLM